MERFVSFQAGSNTIRGALHVPNAGNFLPAIIMCHGFTGNKTGLHRIFVKAARYLCTLGFVVLRFDYSGCGESDGDHRDVTIDRQVSETAAAYNFLLNQSLVDRERIFLLGLSMGGAVATLTAAKLPPVAGLVLWAPVADMYDEIRGIVGDGVFDAAWSHGTADFEGFAISTGFLRSLQTNAPLAAAAKYDGPVLVIHGTGDKEIPYQNTGLYKSARLNLPQPTEIHLVPGADHTFSALHWEDEVFGETASWLDRQLSGAAGQGYSLLTG